MKAVLFCLVVCFVLNSCSIINAGETKSFKSEIVLLKEADYQKDKLVLIYSNMQYELLVPLSIISKYTRNYDEKTLKDYTNNLLDQYVNNSNEQIIKNTKFELGNSYSNKFSINERELFKSGEYLILDTNKNKYIEKVIVKWESWYSGPLSASFDYWVYIDNFVFYEDHLLA